MSKSGFEEGLQETIYRPLATGRVLDYNMQIPGPSEDGEPSELQKLHGHKSLFMSHGIRSLVNDVAFLGSKGLPGVCVCACIDV